MSTHSAPVVAVLGGGVIGVSTARHLARRGAKVVLVTEGQLGSSASGRSLSWLNSAGARSSDYHRLRLVGIDRYRTLAAQQPDADWLRFDGGLTWNAAGRGDELRETHDHEVSIGYDSHLLTPDEVSGRIAGVDPSVIPADGALFNPGEGWVDLPSLIDHLVKDLIDCGGDLLTGTGPATVHLEGGRVSQVRTARGDRLRVDAALLATGAGVPQAAAEFGVEIPDATPLALLVRTEPVDTALRVVLNTPRVALRPAPGGTLAVDSDWTSRSIVATSEDAYDVPREIVEELLGEASKVLAGHPRLRPASYGIGAKPVPGDGEPVLGPLGDIPGLHVAFTHSGATLGLVVGELLAYEIATGTPHPLLAAFRPDRFAR
ncbi:MAG TPA: FAD-binding oxidoreductase [Propionibacteriaceae bacterium]|jgi:glycine/D-amino acid oxidase-like deaminating enzyme